MMASVLIPEMELDKEEAKKLADASKEVAKHYSVYIDPKKLAIANLAAVAGFLYGPRAIAWRARKSGEKKAAAATVPVSPPPASGSSAGSSGSSARAAAASGSAAAPQAKTNGYSSPSQMFGYEPAEDFPGLG
jgi:hypothetical protein